MDWLFAKLASFHRDARFKHMHVPRSVRSDDRRLLNCLYCNSPDKSCDFLPFFEFDIAGKGNTHRKYGRFGQPNPGPRLEFPHMALPCAKQLSKDS
jgi:hypothetical protein